MTRAALESLLAKVEAGTMPWRHYGESDLPYAEAIDSAFHGSLDAAKALHEAVLPGWRLIMLTEAALTAAPWSAVIRSMDGITCRADDRSIASRAWLIAIIRAMLAEEAQSDG